MHRNYSPRRYIASWNNIPLVGVHDGDFYTVEYREEQATLHVGAQGDTTAVLNSDQSATATVRLLPGAAANDLLSALAPDPDNDRLPSGAFIMKDLNGTTVVHAEVAFISKVPAAGAGKELPAREWQFILAKAKIFVGGSLT
jgi:hypothetical protein